MIPILIAAVITASILISGCVSINTPADEIVGEWLCNTGSYDDSNPAEPLTVWHAVLIFHADGTGEYYILYDSDNSVFLEDKIRWSKTADGYTIYVNGPGNTEAEIVGEKLKCWCGVFERTSSALN